MTKSIEEFIKDNGVIKIPAYTPSGDYVNSGISRDRIKKESQRRASGRRKIKLRNPKSRKLPSFKEVWFEEFNCGGKLNKTTMLKIYRSFKCWGTERCFIKQCKNVGLEGYVRNMPLYNRWFPDFAWPYSKIIVEIDGPYHDTKSSISKDKGKDEFLRENGWVVYRLKVPFSKKQAKELAIKIRGMLFS